MRNTQQNSKQAHLLLDLSMIALETFYSFVFKHDRVVQQQTQEFVQNKTTIKVNCYIPYIDFYIQFTPKGILFNLEKPEITPNIEISCTVFGYTSALVFGNKRSLRSIKIYASKEQKDAIRDLLTQLTLPHLIADWQHWIFPTAEHVTKSGKRISSLLDKIDHQRSTINTLQVEVKKQKNRIKHLHKKQRNLNICFSLIIAILLFTLIYHLYLS